MYKLYYTYQAKLVAWYCEYPEVAELGLQCIHRRILVSGASVRGNVHQHHHVATVTRPVDRLLTVYVINLEVVDRPVAATRVITHHFVNILVAAAAAACRCHDNQQNNHGGHHSR